VSIREKPVVWVALLFVAALAIYIALSLAMPIPGFFPDEFLYEHLARSVADGNGFTWHGGDQPLRSALYVYFLVPAWVASSGVDAWHIAKVMGAIASCLTIVPVWFYARHVLPPKLAIVAPVLCLAGTWMLSSAFLVTENIAVPLATAALLAAATAMRRPFSRWPWVALGFALLSAWARMQLVVLVPVIYLVFAVDVVRAGRGWRERLRSYRWVGALGALILALAVIALIVQGSGAVGLYSSVLHFRPNIGVTLRKTGLELIDLTAQTAYFPVLLATALLANRKAWRDDVVGPLLTVFWIATLGLALETGIFLAGVKVVPWGIDRYMAYVVPLVLLLTVVAVARGFAGVRTLAACAVLTLLLLFTPGLGDVTEERSVGATITRVHDVISSASAGVSVFVAALLTCALIYGILRLARGRTNFAVLGVAGLLLLILVVQSQSAWHRTLTFQRAYRTFFPHDLAWVDHHSNQDVANLEITTNPLGYEQYEFFNDKITGYYGAQLNALGRPLLGIACSWQLVKGGYVNFGRGCGRPPSRFLINDPTGFVTFHNESQVARDPQGGKLVTVNGRPRVQSVVYMPCPPRRIGFTRPWGDQLPANRPEQCLNYLRAYLWADAPSTLLVNIKGGIIPHTAQVGQKQYAIAPGRDTTVRVPIKPGGQLAQMLFDWDGIGQQQPVVTRVSLQTGANTQPLV
jgi:hypothetical protein